MFLNKLFQDFWGKSSQVNPLSTQFITSSGYQRGKKILKASPIPGLRGLAQSLGLLAQSQSVVHLPNPIKLMRSTGSWANYVGSAPLRMTSISKQTRKKNPLHWVLLPVLASQNELAEHISRRRVLTPLTLSTMGKKQHTPAIYKRLHFE